jgi:hypothetical protein
VRISAASGVSPDLTNKNFFEVVFLGHAHSNSNPHPL